MSAGVAVADMLGFAQTYDMERYGAEGGPLHDPNVIAWLHRTIRPTQDALSTIVGTNGAAGHPLAQS